MIHRIEIASKINDTRAQARKKKLENIGISGSINELFLIDVYTIDKKLTKDQIKIISLALANPVTQKTSYTQAIFPENFSFAIEIGFLPGVTDNVANTVKELISDLLQTSFSEKENVYTSQMTFLNGNLTEDEIDTIALSLHNPLIQKARIKTYRQFIKDNGMGKYIPSVNLSQTIKVDTINLKINDEELIAIGKQGIKNLDGTRRGPLALDLNYMKAIQAYFNKKGRNPTDVELESIAQTWSEHCKHTIFADPIDDIKYGLYETYIKAATQKIRKERGDKDICVSVFTDNSGAIIFDNKYLVSDKVETHNSPSALDPFGGSITGIVGVNRDAIGFGLGAKPIINRYGFCFADPNDISPLYKGPNKTQKMLSPRRIMDGVIDGVNSGGNCSGIPTPQGFMYFDKRYKGKPLVFVGTVGLIPKKIKNNKAYIKKAKIGDYIVVIGGRVGKDGIHGATFSSEAMDSGSPATAVQIGDPITQKKLSDAIVKEARDLGLFNSITDNGAGGLSCSVAEMAKETGGCTVSLEQIPLKYPGLAPWEIWISESQERMTLAITKGKWKEFENLMRRRGVEATIIGTFTDTGKCIVQYKGKIVMDIEIDFLHNGLPPRPMKTIYKQPEYEEPVIRQKHSMTKTILSMLSRLNIASNEFISTQYDHEVQSGSVLKPLQGRGRVNADATVTRPVLSSNRGIVLSQALYPGYSDIDTYDMAACSIDTAIRNAIVTGGSVDNLALLDNFCWCSANDPFRLGQLKRAAQACYDYSIAYGIPFISGKDSMFNDFKGFDETGMPIIISIPPTLLISSLGVIKDITKVISLDAKLPEDLLYIIGETHNEMGGSEYYSMIGEQKQGKPYIGKRVPKVFARQNKKLYKAFTSCMQQGLIASAISITRGGLAIALMKKMMGGMLGVDVSLRKLPGTVKRNDYALFSESQGRILLTIAPENRKRFEVLMKGVSFTMLGKVTKNPLIKIKGFDGNNIVTLRVDKALNKYKETFAEY
jgi:phosphoribosylformylglycinamidine synthase subunit PurSL